MKRVVLTVALLMAFGVSQAQAAYVGTTPNTNNVLGNVEGWFGANLFLIAGGNTTVTVEFLGKEAGFINRFFLNGVETHTTADYGNTSQFPSPPNPGVVTGVDAQNFVIAPGLINFMFTSNLGTGNLNQDSVTNGTNVVPGGGLGALNYFITLGPAPANTFTGDRLLNGVTPGSGQVAIIALDDTGAGPDDNHDDMVIRLSITNGSFGVPDGGATLMLLGGALLGIGALRRRFNV